MPGIAYVAVDAYTRYAAENLPLTWVVSRKSFWGKGRSSDATFSTYPDEFEGVQR